MNTLNILIIETMLGVILGPIYSNDLLDQVINDDYLL